MKAPHVVTVIYARGKLVEHGAFSVRGMQVSDAELRTVAEDPTVIEIFCDQCGDDSDHCPTVRKVPGVLAGLAQSSEYRTAHRRTEV